MAKFNIHFSLLTIAVCLGCGSELMAAPSVKRLGVGNSFGGTTTATAAKYGNVNRNVGNTIGRSASVKTNSIGKLKPATIKAGGSANAANPARLSVGKYLHAAGVSNNVIKPVNNVTAGSAGIENNYYTKSEIDTAINNYKDEINQIKTDVENLTTTVKDEDTGLLKRVEDLENASETGGNTVSVWDPSVLEETQTEP